MPTRPGTLVTLRNTPSQVSIPTDTGVAFHAGLTDMGPLAPQIIYSLNDFVAIYGARQTYSYSYDWFDVFFREGGNKAFVTRVVGPNPTSGFKNLVDGVAAISLIVTAIGPGAWSANYKVACVVPGAGGAGTYKIQITDAANVVLEDSGDLVDQAGAIAWSQFSRYVRISLGASALIPVNTAAAALSAGTDDRANIVDAQWQNAWDRFIKDLGPGQIAAPQRNALAGWNQMLAHAAANNRVALIDYTNIATDSTLQGFAATIRSRYAASFAPWIVVPGVIGGISRTLPSSALLAGLIARNDPSLGANRASAGNAGVAEYVTDISQPDWTEAQRTTLNSVGVNVIRRFQNGIRVYGARSLADPSNDSNWIWFPNARLYMQISALLNQIAENFLFEEIDGQNGETISRFHAALLAPLTSLFESRQLFGDSADQAFNVDVGPSVNTLVTIAALELHAVVSVKMAPGAEFVQIEIVKRAVTEVL